MPVILVDTSSGGQVMAQKNPLLNFQPEVVILMADSEVQLKNDLKLLQRVRWNHMASYYILEANQMCDKGILVATSMVDISKATYICTKSEDIMLYILNSISNYAPKPWTQVGTSRSSTEQWTMYSQRFKSGN